jgi:hypothetical protein
VNLRALISVAETVMRYVFKAVDIGVSTVFLALCTKAFCIHFYRDIKRQLHASETSARQDKPLLIPSNEIAKTQLRL